MTITRASTVASDAALIIIVLGPLNIFAVQVDDGGSSGVEELRGWLAELFPCRVWSTEVCGS